MHDPRRIWQKSKYLSSERAAAIYHSFPNVFRDQFLVSTGHYTDLICLATSTCPVSSCPAHKMDLNIASASNFLIRWAQSPGRPRAVLQTEDLRMNHGHCAAPGIPVRVYTADTKKTQVKGTLADHLLLLSLLNNNILKSVLDPNSINSREVLYFPVALADWHLARCVQMCWGYMVFCRLVKNRNSSKQTGLRSEFYGQEDSCCYWNTGELFQ